MKDTSKRIVAFNTQFCQFPSGNILPDIWELIDQGAWKSLAPETYENNIKLGELNRSKSRPIISDILALHRGMVWDDQNKCLTDPCFRPELKPTGRHDFLLAAEYFFEQYKEKHIGVHLSGGLDSSIIICLLKHFNISFSLVGMTTERYEFRTERHIQQLLAEYGRDAVLIDYEAHLPMSGIDTVPPHQHPDMLSMNYHASIAMAEECKRMGIEILLTGNGGDNVFAEPVAVNPEACNWMPQIFIDSWLDDFAYRPYGIEVVPFYADQGILNMLYNLRYGQKEDNLKIWARNYFKEYIPQELVNYTYCADFWGLYIDGLQNALPTVKHLMEKAYDLTGNIYFSPKRTTELFGQDLLDANKTMYQEIESRISLAIWLNALNK